MKKVLLILSVAVVMLSALVGCSGFKYVNSNVEIDVFGAFASYGGVVDKIEVSHVGDLRLYASFSDASDIHKVERALNVENNAISEARYTSGYRVIGVTKTNGKKAEFYCASIAGLRCSDFGFSSVASYREQFTFPELMDEIHAVIAPESIPEEKLVFYAEDIGQVQIVIKGSVFACSKDGNVEYSGNTLRFASSDCVIVFSQSHTVYIIIGIGVSVLVLGGVLLILARCNVFTKIKLKNAKK